MTMWSTHPTSSLHFFCDNGNCLNDINMVCNFENDCGDNSDENECGMYSLLHLVVSVVTFDSQNVTFFK